MVINRALESTISDRYKSNYNSKLVNRNNSLILSYSILVGCGIQLGGNINSSNIRNLSVAYAKKNKNYIIKLSVTSVQLKKSIRLMSRYIRTKSTIYFVHSHFGFKLLMNQLYHKTNMLYLTFTTMSKSKLTYKKSKMYNFAFGQLKKLYFITKWKPGLLTNRIDFFKLRLLKQTRTRYPRYGYSNDYKINKVCIRELNNSNVPFSSILNLDVLNKNCGFFDIPGNGRSYDTFF